MMLRLHFVENGKVCADAKIQLQTQIIILVIVHFFSKPTQTTESPQAQDVLAAELYWLYLFKDRRPRSLQGECFAISNDFLLTGNFLLPICVASYPFSHKGGFNYTLHILIP